MRPRRGREATATFVPLKDYGKPSHRDTRQHLSGNADDLAVSASVSDVAAIRHSFACAHRAVTATRRTERFDALDRAERLAQLFGQDGNHAWTAFGPTTVVIHRVSVVEEIGDAVEALNAAAAADLSLLRDRLQRRRAEVPPRSRSRSGAEQATRRGRIACNDSLCGRRLL